MRRWKRRDNGCTEPRNGNEAAGSIRMLACRRSAWECGLFQRTSSYFKAPFGSCGGPPVYSCRAWRPGDGQTGGKRGPFSLHTSPNRRTKAVPACPSALSPPDNRGMAKAPGPPHTGRGGRAEGLGVTSVID